jgi:hypothetical protein
LPAAASQEPAPDDCRCLCGNLLARLVAGGVELKCRRCKRTVVIPLAGSASSNHPEARGTAPRAQSARGARLAPPLPGPEPGPCLSALSVSDS